MLNDMDKSQSGFKEGRSVNDHKLLKKQLKEKKEKVLINYSWMSLTRKIHLMGLQESLKNRRKK